MQSAPFFEADKGPTGQSQVLLFGDLSLVQFENQLRGLLHIKTNPLLISFFDRVNFSLRRLVENLPAQQQALFPHFTTLVDLIARLGETDGTSVLRFFLLSVYEVAQYIVYFGQGSVPLPSPPNTYIIGPCTGGFAAAAISCSQTLPDLITNGVEAVLAAFRTALCSYLVGQNLSKAQASQSQSWSAALSAQGDVVIHDILNEYTKSTTPLRDSTLWVSATTLGKTTTLSGRPSVLQDFLTTNSSRVKSRSMEIDSPYHAAHLFDASDVEEIVALVRDDAVAGQIPRLSLISSSTGKIVEASNFTSLIRTVVQEALEEPIRWDKVLPSLCAILDQAGIQKCNVLPFSSSAAPMVSTTITKNAGIEVVIEDLAAQATNNIPTQPTGKFADSKIAIVGYSGRFPDSASNEEFWDLLTNGRDVHREIPADRFDWKTHYDPTGKTKNTSRIKYGCFIKEPGLFDTRFFNMSPKEAENTDPAQRLAIMTTYEAMEMAGFVSNRTPSTQCDRVGVFFGTTSDDYREVNSGQDVGTYFIPGGNRAFVPGRISYFFRLSGPSLSFDTACSSSFAAIQAACTYLWRGDCDTTIAGGTNVVTNSDNFAGLDRGHFLSTTGNCNTFDDDASGYCRSDAVGSVILKRLEDAEADHDPIFGVILGSNTNHCGQTDSITRPHEGDQTSVFKRITRHANVDPLDVSYVEMHGTGTQAGDATEMGSVLSVFGSDYKRTTLEPARPLFLGSAKANIGHAESASGVSSLIKVLMMMKHSQIPPHVGIKTKINHNFPLDLPQRGVNIAFKNTPWRRQDSISNKRAAFLNNFSAAGGNTAMLIEDAPEAKATAETDPRPIHIVTATAKSPKAIGGNIDTLVSYLEGNPSTSLAKLSYTTTARRSHHNHRIVVSGADVPSVLSALKARIAESDKIKAIPSAAKKQQRVVFTFSGQGTLYASLGKSLYDTNPVFRTRILQLNRLAKSQGFAPFIGVIDGSVSAADISDKKVGAVVSQLVLLCVQIALSELWKSWGVEPIAVVGHSLGEYAALYTAGVLSVADAIYLAGTRAAILEKRCTAGTHSMLAVKASLEVTNKLMQKSSGCELACANQPSGHVIAGPVEKIAEVATAAAGLGLETVKLEIPYAFHSAQVEPILAEFEKAAAQGVTYHPPTVPVISPLLAKVIPAGDSATLNGSYLTSACRSTVDFTGALAAAAADDVLSLGAAERTIWLDIGPHPICSGMVKGTLGSNSNTVATLRKDVDAYKTLAKTLEVLYLAGIDINWNEYHRDFPASHEVVDLPRYHWDLKNYWIQYRGDFCLYKGDAPVQKTIESAPAPVEAKIVRKYISPTAQEIVEESHGTDQSSLLIESDIFDARLLHVLEGHLLNGTRLCPSSMYADLALVMAKYLLSNSPNQLPLDTTGLDVSSMVVESSLIAHTHETQHCYRASAKADWATNSIKIAIYSVDSTGKRTTSHGRITVLVVPKQNWIAEWRRNTHFITSRIDSLSRADSDSHMIKRGMAYKLFNALVEYKESYQGMSQVIMDSKRLEAVSTVQFQVESEGFTANPKWIDSLGHIAGFIMNANDAVDSRSQVFINHGWEHMRIAETLEKGKTYRAYNRMQLVEKTNYIGDTYILDGDKIIAIFEGVAFQGVPRKVLEAFFPGNKSSVGPAKQATAKAVPAVSPPKPASKQAAKETAPLSAPIPKVKKSVDTSSGVIGRMLALIGSEIGVSTSELKSDSEFADLGLDSLLSLTILSKIREELGMEFPPSLFVDYPTVGDLQVFVGGGEAASYDTASSSGSDEGETQLTRATSVDLESEQVLEAKSGVQSSGRADALLALRQIIADESGVAIADLTPSTNFADIGVDSLLSLTIGGKLLEVLNVDIPGAAFNEFETLQDVEDAVCKELGFGDDKSLPAKSSTAPKKGFSYPDTQLAQGETIPQAVPGDSPPHATSILLSGSPKTAQTVLFLFPDGSGSASSYAAMAPTFDPSKIAVYGLNCPWRKSGPEMTRLGVTMSSYVAKYVAEVRRLLTFDASIAVGGWSAGGILAVEAARQLEEQNIKVSQLLLLDSPNPIGLQNPPQRMYDFFDKLGIFGGGKATKTPEWLRLHFNAFLTILDAYEPTPLPNAPKTLILYAKDGVCKDPNGPKMETFPDDPREMFWLLNNRTDFSAEGWASVLGRDKVAVSVLDEVNHFSLVDPGPKMLEMGKTVTKFLL